MRKELICTVANGAVHFIAPTLLQGENNNLWFPLRNNGNVIDHEEIEGLLLLNKVAHNVVSIEEIRECGHGIDYKVVINEYQKGESDQLLSEYLAKRA